MTHPHSADQTAFGGPARAIPARPDVDAIAARAAAAPAGRWEAGLDCLQVPWSVPYDPDDFARTDDDTDDPLCSGRWLAVREGWWHRGSPDPSPELWEFLAAARGDVLELVAEIRRLRAAQRSGAHRSPAADRRKKAVHGRGAGRGRLSAVTAGASHGREGSSGTRPLRAAADTVGDRTRDQSGAYRDDSGAGARTRRSA